MASLWQKTLWALGLTDDENLDGDDEATPQAQVRTVDAPAAEPPAEPRPATQAITGARARVAGRRVEPPASSRHMISDNPQHAEAGVYVRETTSVATARPGVRRGVEVIGARTFSDAQLLADHIRAGVAVALDLRNAETAMVRRLVDFSSGLTYGLGGKMVKIAQGVILVTPANVVISAEDRRHLTDLGLYSAPGEG